MIRNTPGKHYKMGPNQVFLASMLNSSCCVNLVSAFGTRHVIVGFSLPTTIFHFKTFSVYISERALPRRDTSLLRLKFKVATHS